MNHSTLDRVLVARMLLWETTRRNLQPKEGEG
jgi:hypothetical protein